MKINNGGFKIVLKDKATSPTVTLEIDVISNYNISWSNEFDTDEQGNMVYLSRTASLSVSTGALNEADCSSLIAMLKLNTLHMTSPQINGMVTITGFDAPVEVSNFFGRYYRVSFTAEWRDGTRTPVSIGDITPIASYSGQFNAEVETFEAYDFKTVEIWKGKRFSCEFTTGQVDKSKLYNVTDGWVNKLLAKRWVTLTVPDGHYNFAVDNVSTAMAQGGKYTMSVSLKSIDLIAYPSQQRPTPIVDPW